MGGGTGVGLDPGGGSRGASAGGLGMRANWGACHWFGGTTRLRAGDRHAAYDFWLASLGCGFSANVFAPTAFLSSRKALSSNSSA